MQTAQRGKGQSILSFLHSAMRQLRAVVCAASFPGAKSDQSLAGKLRTQHRKASSIRKARASPARESSTRDFALLIFSRSVREQSPEAKLRPHSLSPASSVELVQKSLQPLACIPKSSNVLGVCLPIQEQRYAADTVLIRFKVPGKPAALPQIKAFRQIGGEGETSAEDKEAEAEAEAERLEALREAEERRKDKHRKMEEERERMRQGIRDKYGIKKKEEIKPEPEEDMGPAGLNRRKKTPEEIAAENEAAEQDELTSK
ncbi:complexin-like [Tropilaelaps mercedesae]|uniref:Complexin-like n=1 Tax=Tropilaelaps mercedesae TaxID=418985 RepID=A0A1V9XK88_9ACAR|nr:complexin-like [Tropilaelaps mercedesae]